jgi:hypothetical protein
VYQVKSFILEFSTEGPSQSEIQSVDNGDNTALVEYKVRYTMYMHLLTRFSLSNLESTKSMF